MDPKDTRLISGDFCPWNSFRCDACLRNENGTYRPKLLKDEEDLKDLGIYVYTYSPHSNIIKSASHGPTVLARVLLDVAWVPSRDLPYWFKSGQTPSHWT